MRSASPLTKLRAASASLCATCDWASLIWLAISATCALARATAIWYSRASSATSRWPCVTCSPTRAGSAAMRPPTAMPSCASFTGVAAALSR